MPPPFYSASRDPELLRIPLVEHEAQLRASALAAEREARAREIIEELEEQLNSSVEQAS